MIVEFVKISIPTLGIIGILSNALLIYLILFHSPSSLKIYATFFFASACCDIVSLTAMIVGTANEVVFGGSCVLEFYGPCTLLGEESCWISFGVHEYMFSSTGLLLCLSFAYRYNALNGTSAVHQRAVTIVIALVVIVHSPLIFVYYRILSLVRTQSKFMDSFRASRVEVSENLGLIYVPDPFSFTFMSLACGSTLVFFVVSIVLRNKMIKHFRQYEKTMSGLVKSQAKMLNQALNIQLALSSFFFIGSTAYSLNFIQFESFSMPETSFLAIPICNLQSVLTPLATIYIISPYRRAIIGSWRAIEQPMHSSTTATQPIE